MLKFRRIVEELEADLYKVPKPKWFPREMGEIEQTKDSDGNVRFKFVARGLDADRVEVFADEELLFEIQVVDKKVTMRLDSERGQEVPNVSLGQVIEVRDGPEILLRGVVEPD